MTTSSRPVRPSRPVSKRAWVVVFACLFALVTIAGSVLVVARGAAAWVDVNETGLPGHLALRSDPGTPYWADLRPGDTVHWFVEASLADADEAALRLELDADGPLVEAGEMTVAVDGCSAPFTRVASSPRCDGVAEKIVASASLGSIVSDAGDDSYPLAELHRDAPRYVLVTLQLAPSAAPDAVAGATARIGVGLHAEGESVNGGGELATTGAEANDLAPVAMLAIGLVGLGACAVLWRRSRAVSAA